MPLSVDWRDSVGSVAKVVTGLWAVQDHTGQCKRG